MKYSILFYRNSYIMYKNNFRMFHCIFIIPVL